MDTIEALRQQLERIEDLVQRTNSVHDFIEEINMVYIASRKLKWDEGIARSMCLQRNINELNGDQEMAISLNSKAMKIAKINKFDKIEIDCNLSRSISLFRQGKMSEGYIVAKVAHDKAERLQIPFLLSSCKFFLGVVAQRFFSDDKALMFFNQGLEIAQEKGFLKTEQFILHNISELFLTRQQFQKAEQYAKRLVAIQQNAGNISFRLRSEIRLVTILLELNREKQIRHSIKEIKQHIQYLSNAERGTLCVCEGKLLSKTGNYSEAKIYFDQAIDIFNSIGDYRLVVNTCAIACEMYLLSKDKMKAISYSKNALKHIKTDQDEYLTTEVYRLVYEAYKLAKNARMTLKYLELYNEKLKKQEEQLLQTRIQFIELDSQSKKREIEYIKEKRKSEEFKFELEQKERELTEKTRHLIKQTESLAQFRDDLRAIVRRSSVDDPLIKQIKQRLKDLPQSQLEWKDFDTQFLTIHPTFHIKLEQKHPNLTTMEKKICALLRLGLTSIDMASLLFLSERNIENHRYRIRKKLLLNTEISLHEYINAI